MTDRFYSSEQADLSQAVLEQLHAEIPDFTLIGGWGTWVRVGGDKSHDIDLIVRRDQLVRIEAIADEYSRSDHIAGTKWRATWQRIHIDLYVPYASRLGENLQLRVEALTPHTETVRGYRLLTPAGHTATKIAALLDRPDSQPGIKDRLEILMLLETEDGEQTPAIIAQASTRDHHQLTKLLETAFALLDEAPTLGRSERSRLRHTHDRWQRTLALSRPV